MMSLSCNATWCNLLSQICPKGLSAALHRMDTGVELLHILVDAIIDLCRYSWLSVTLRYTRTTRSRQPHVVQAFFTVRFFLMLAPAPSRSTVLIHVQDVGSALVRDCTACRLQCSLPYLIYHINYHTIYPPSGPRHSSARLTAPPGVIYQIAITVSLTSQSSTQLWFEAVCARSRNIGCRQSRTFWTLMPLAWTRGGTARAVTR